MKKILVTGGAGFIGSHTCVELIDAGYEPIIIDNFSNSDEKVIDALKIITGKSIKVYNLDCADFASFEALFKSEKEIDGIIHFAAYKAVGESSRDPFKYYQNNVNSTLNVLEAMKQFGVKKLVFSSSCTVYGQPDELPVNESSPVVSAASPYGHTKQINEDMIFQYQKINSELQSVILRYFNPIGAHPSALIGELPIGKPENLVPFVTQTAAGLRDEITIFGNDYNTHDGTCIRDYLHVVDLAKAHVKSLDLMQSFKGDRNLEILNLGYGKGFSVLDIVKTFEKISNQSVNYKFGPRRKGDVEQIYSSSDKANKLLNWQCEYGLEDMLRHAWEWQKKLAVGSSQ